jgi:hypothetical protein
MYPLAITMSHVNCSTRCRDVSVFNISRKIRITFA